MDDRWPAYYLLPYRMFCFSPVPPRNSYGLLWRDDRDRPNTSRYGDSPGVDTGTTGNAVSDFFEFGTELEVSV